MFGEHTFVEVILFCALIVVFLWLDLRAHKHGKAVSVRDAIAWSALWVALAFVFMGYVWKIHGTGQAQLFLTGYLLEKSLSVDNLFVIMAVFVSFRVPDHLQHRVLYYGVLGALVMRFLFIAAGTGLVTLFGPYALAAFGLFVLWSAWKMWQHMNADHSEEVDYTQHWAVRLARRFIPIHPFMEGHSFFVQRPPNSQQNAGQQGNSQHSTAGKLVWMATPLFLCLVVVEVADIMFAFDSVPAVIAITEDPFLIYTSNIFAILGLRSLYFLLAAAKRALRHLEKSVIVILVYIGAKMLLDVAGIIHLSPMTSLSVVLGLLTLGIVASLVPERAAKS